MISFVKRVKREGLAIGLFLVSLGFKAQAADVQLAWDPPTSNADGTVLMDLTGFKVFCGTTSRNYSTVTTVGNTNTCAVTGLLQGSTYYFAVTAVDGNAVESDYSSELVWTVPDTTAPSISVTATASLTADASGLASVPNLTQNATVSDNCSPVSSISLTQSPVAGSLIGVGTTSVLLTATDAAGNSAQATVLVTVSAPPPVVEPSPPTNTQVVVVATLPAPWSTQDIGTGIAAGNVSVSNDVYTVSGAGNISGTADNFRYVYQTLSGDGEIKARVAALQNAGTGAKAGIMIRESLTGGSRHAALSLLANGQVEFLRRSSTGSSSKTTLSTGNVAPNNWIRLVRNGSKIIAYKSSNGTSWTSIGSQTITMASTISIGLVTASGNTTSLSTATTANVTVTP